ncbi:hypothetical protein [Bradyrhizobium prioriisuperbiae]|uniref:hypothetical protein n=1 Tax=Bradyrhizobium prioriisuperbiae TaxID=2854389 RepID=UPI0028EEC7B9|nr:hypothetical protein [Bradyrhizobium prioritasuperba]
MASYKITLTDPLFGDIKTFPVTKDQFKSTMGQGVLVKFQKSAGTVIFPRQVQLDDFPGSSLGIRATPNGTAASVDARLLFTLNLPSDDGQTKPFLAASTVIVGTTLGTPPPSAELDGLGAIQVGHDGDD